MANKVIQPVSKKDQLVNDIIKDLKSNMYDDYSFIFDLVRESLLTRSNKELDYILNGE